MRGIILSCLFIMCSVAFVNAQDITEAKHQLDWKESFKKAEKLSSKKDKPLLIFFTGSDWCGPCKMLVEDVFTSEKFAEMAHSFVLYEADFPRSSDLVTTEQRANNKKLKSKYKISSYPTILILNSKGKEIGRKKGYNLMRDSSYHFNFFKETIK